MNTAPTLRIFVTRRWPQVDGACAWALVGPDQRVVSRGVGAAGQWPAAAACEAVVSADQVSWFSAELPDKLGRDAARIIGYALEDRLPGSPEDMHFVVQRRPGRSAASVLAIGRERLREILSGFTAASRPLRRLVVDMQLPAVEPGDWLLGGSDGNAFLRTGPDSGLAIDRDGNAPPATLMLAMQQARVRGDAPVRLVVATSPAMAPDTTAWAAALGVAVELRPEFDPLTADENVVANLLTDDFSPAARGGKPNRSLRLAAIVLLVAGVAHTLLSLGDWARLAWQAASLRREAVAIYREAVPGSNVPLLNANLQLHRAAASTLRAHGRIGRTEMLAMLSVLVDALPPGAKLRRLQFDAAALDVVVALPAGAEAGIGESLRLRGYGHATKLSRADPVAPEFSIRMTLP